MTLNFRYRQLSGRRSAVRLCWSALVLIASVLPAHTQAGTWQATLPVGNDPRLVLQIRETPTRRLEGSLDFIDRGSTGAPLLSVTYTAPELQFTVGAIAYRGRLSPDGHTFAGIWTNGSDTFPLTFTRATPDTLWTYAGIAPLQPMVATADPSFEVATIKPSRPDTQTSIPVRARLFHTTNTTVIDLLRFAYHLQPRQVEGGPPWRDTEHFDLAAEPDTPGQPSVAQQRRMVQKLLASRFGLVVHQTHPVLPVYSLVRTDTTALKASQRGEVAGSIYPHDTGSGDTAVQFAFMSMAEFADILMNFLPERQIVDDTHLAGQFDFVLLLPTSLVHGDAGLDLADKAGAFLNALPRAGFRLVPEKRPVEVLVIDKLDQPTPN